MSLGTGRRLLGSRKDIEARPARYELPDRPAKALWGGLEGCHGGANLPHHPAA